MIKTDCFNYNLDDNYTFDDMTSESALNSKNYQFPNQIDFLINEQYYQYEFNLMFIHTFLSSGIIK